MADDATRTKTRRLGRAERREQILDAAARALVTRGGFAATNLDDVAAEAGVTRVILYRHFETRSDLYRAVLDRAGARLYEATTLGGELHEGSVNGMLAWAARDPDGFRLLFHHAARDPEYRADLDELRGAMVDRVHTQLAQETTDHEWTGWAASLATTVTIEAIMAWLDAGQPDHDHAAEHVLSAISGVFEAVGIH